MLHIFPFKTINVGINFIPDYYYVLLDNLDYEIDYSVTSFMNLIDTLCAVINGYE